MCRVIRYTHIVSHVCICQDELDGKVIDDVNMRLLRRKKGRNENPVTAYVKVVGSDNGSCEPKDENPGCDQNYRLIANQYADGTVVGTFLDVSTGVYDTSIGEETLQVKADINCLNFIELEDGGIAVIYSGPWTAPTSGTLSFLTRDVNPLDFLGAAKIDGDGNTFYTTDSARLDDPDLCNTVGLEIFEDLTTYSRTGGLVDIESDVQSAPWTDKGD